MTRLLKKMHIKSIVFLSYNSYLLFKLATDTYTSYENSIYDGYGTFFWNTLYLCVFLTYGLLFYSSLSNKDNSKSFMYLIVYFNTIFLLIPSFRGYPSYSSIGDDAFFHIRHIHIINNTGKISISLIYPITHIIASIFLQIGFTMKSITSFLPIIYYNFYIVSLFTLIKKVFKKTSKNMFIMSLSIFMPFSQAQQSFAPSHLAFWFFPFFILLVYRYHFVSNSRANLYLIITCFIMYLFFHPANAFESIMFILLTCLTSFIIVNKFKHIKIPNVNFTYMFYTMIIYVTWLFFNARAYLTFSQMLNRLIIDIFQGSISQYNYNTISSTNLKLSSIIRYAYYQYGQYFMHIIITFCSGYWILRKAVLKRIGIYEAHLEIQLFGSICLFIIFYFINLGTFNIIRTFRYPFLIMILINGNFLFETSNKLKSFKKITFITLLLIGLFFSNYSSFYNVYPSPRIFVQNRQFTLSEEFGIDWFKLNSHESIPLIANGYTSTDGKDLLRGEKLVVTKIPSHFGYDTEKDIASSAQIQSYLITNEALRKTHLTFISANPNTLRYTSEDFIKLESELNVLNVYRNAWFEIRYIFPRN